MPNIKITKNNDGYGYEYMIIGSDNKRRYVRKSGFKTSNEAYKAGEKSYNRRLDKGYTEVKSNPIQIKNLDISGLCLNLLTKTVAVGTVITIVAGGIKLKEDLKERFPSTPKEDYVSRVYSAARREIERSECDFSNLHIIIRSSKSEVTGVAAVTADQLTRLGVSNELIGVGSDIAYNVGLAIAEHPNSDIVLINLETKLENADTDRTIIMGDSSNRREYPSDVLASCINTSLREYSLNPCIRSGQATGQGWRLSSYLETTLDNAVLVNSLSQLTIDLPITVSEDEIIRNDAASSIVEGIMRWTTLEHNERYENIYYTVTYGETLDEIADRYNTSCIELERNSDINPHKPLSVGDTITVGEIPSPAEDTVTVNNPYTTTDINSIEPVIYTYVVASGDTLTQIANRYGVKVEDIITESGDPNNIRIGETLYITTYTMYETHERINLLEEENQNTL